MFLKVTKVDKAFHLEKVLSEVSFSLGARQLLSIVGRSGCGKTTLLRIIAGLETADSGSVELDGKRMDKVPPHRREIVYLYQEPLLFPHLNAIENIAFGLRLRKLDKGLINTRANEMLEKLGLAGLSGRMPGKLSGGQRQRVAFGRALIIKPKLLLLDEPFGALDSETRAQMQGFLRNMVEEFGITTLFVTHDLKEALVMGQRIGAMRAGTLEIYPDKRSFVQDSRNGAEEEIRFWSGWDKS